MNRRGFLKSLGIVPAVFVAPNLSALPENGLTINDNNTTTFLDKNSTSGIRHIAGEKIHSGDFVYKSKNGICYSKYHTMPGENKSVDMIGLALNDCEKGGRIKVSYLGKCEVTCE